MAEKSVAHCIPPKVPRPVPAPGAVSPKISDLESRLLAGSLSSEQLSCELERTMRAGTPLVEPVDGNPSEAIVTFLHHDSRADQVLLFINRLTDEKNLAESLMRRVGETGYRSLSYRMRRDWRASYCFIPLLRKSLESVLGKNQVQLRSVLDRGDTDVFNPKRCLNRQGKAMSLVELDAAPVQSYVPDFDDLPDLGEPNWQVGPNGRPLAVVPVGKPEPDSPTLLVFDGEIWQSMGLVPLLRAACAAGELIPLHIVLMHSGGRETRWAELGGNAPITSYLVDDVLPWLRQHGVESPPQDTLLCGQSLGGLAALVAVLEQPECFGGVLSQSASLWQPVAMSRLQHLVENGESSRLSELCIDLQVGEQEWVLEPLHREFVRLLSTTPVRLRYEVYNGGHDYACWRGGIFPALKFALQS